MKKLTWLFMLFCCTSVAYTQPDELDQLLANDEPAFPIIGTFKGTRVINFSSVEVMGKNSLEFRIAHRFGDIAGSAGGINRLFGLDGPVALHLAFDYSLSDRLSVGFGRTNLGQLLDGNVKYRILRQSSDDKMPISLTYLGRANITHREPLFDREFDQFRNRMSYVNHLMLARKFNKSLSLQANFMLFHQNLVQTRADQHTSTAVGLSGRYKITKRVAVTAEWMQMLGNYAPNLSLFYAPISIGVDLETGGHVFQLFVSNAFEINEIQAIPYNQRNWQNGQFRFGFNVSRAFTLNK
jgi:hypothetical protein